MSKVMLFTDGACKGNPGIGGWGAVIWQDSGESEFYDGELNTTNNRMEMMAAIRGLAELPDGSDVILTTDSQYVMKGIQEWMAGWKRRGWKTADKQPVKNVELWKQLDAQTQRHTIEWKWVRGHTGHPGNERADQLANLGVQKARRRG